MLLQPECLSLVTTATSSCPAWSSVLGHKGATAGVAFSWNLTAPVEVVDNARVAFAAPTVSTPLSCSSFTGRTMDELASRYSDVLLSAMGTCDMSYMTNTTEGGGTAEVKLNVGLSTPRIDASTPPATLNDTNELVWTAPDQITVRANFSDVTEEALGQRFLFIAGAAVGIAFAIMPVGAQLMYFSWSALGNSQGSRRAKNAASSSKAP